MVDFEYHKELYIGVLKECKNKKDLKRWRYNFLNSNHFDREGFLINVHLYGADFCPLKELKKELNKFSEMEYFIKENYKKYKNMLK